VLDSNGQVVEIQEYDPYGKTSFFDGAGNPVGSWSQVGNPFGLKAVRIDPETGLLYMRHRYYSPQWGRFLTQDPLGVWGDPATWGNSYSYGSASPLVQGDPLGLQVALPIINGVIPGLNSQNHVERDVRVPSHYPQNGIIIISNSAAEALWLSAGPPPEEGEVRPEIPESVRVLPGWAESLRFLGGSPYLSELAALAMATHDTIGAGADLFTGNPRRGARELAKGAALAVVFAGFAAIATGHKMWGGVKKFLGVPCQQAASGGARLLNPPINITGKGLKHTLERHAAGGAARFAGKSKFNAGEDIAALIRSGTQQPMVRQANGNFARTFDVGREIGFDRNVGGPTSIMTIITRSNGDLVTAFPGRP
jgi:RHS repeat-associated protein